jgi:hypothetical protein
MKNNNGAELGRIQLGVRQLHQQTMEMSFKVFMAQYWHGI